LYYFGALCADLVLSITISYNKTILCIVLGAVLLINGTI